MQQAAAGTALRTLQALRVCSSAGTSTSAVLGSVSLWTPDAFSQWQCKRWATKKQGGSTKNKADSNPKHLGCKMLEGELIFPGQIIVRQRGTRFRPGLNVGLGKDHTIFSKSVGHVHFRRETRSKEGRPMQELRVIDVLPLEGDHSPGYKERVAAMVAARAQLRARMLGLRAKYN